MATLIQLGPNGESASTWDLSPGRNTLGAAGSDIELPGVAAGQLHLDAGTRTLEVPAGSAELRVDGEAGERFVLRSGARIEWAGLSLRFEDEARLDEVLAAPENVGWRRVKAGLLVELGRADRKAAKRWQEAVANGKFDADAAATEILAASGISDDDPALLERSGRLGRDLLMQPTLRGARGAARGARRAGRNLFAYIVTQTMVLVLFALLFVAGLAVAHYEGVELDPLLDKIVPEKPASDG